jgi:histidine triad (HIT) family protein
MPITDEQAKQIKEQILSQIESFPEAKRKEAKSQIEAMNNEQLESFLIQNNMISSPGDGVQQSPGANTDSIQGQCIFCSIIDGKIPSHKIDEDKESIAILEINPISKGHTLIIPKKHIESQEDIPSSSYKLANKIARKLKTILKPIPKEVSISSWSMFGHSIINVLPIYNDENISSQRTKAKESDLIELQNKLKKKESLPKERKPRTKKIDLRKSKKNRIKLPQRIP